MGTPRRPRPLLRTALAVALATPVHLLSLAIAALGVWLLWPGHGLWFGLLGLGCLLFAATLVLHPLRVRRRYWPASSVLDLRRSAATVALLRKIAGAVGGSVPGRCVVTTSYGARSRISRHGRTLEVGAPLWLALDSEERVALLARTLAPRGSARSLVDAYVTAALWSVGRWQDMFSPIRPGDPQAVYDPVIVATEASVITSRAEYRLGTDVVTLLLSPLRLMAAGYGRLLGVVADPLLQACNERVERAAEAAAGTAALAELQRALGDGVVVAGVLQHATRHGLDLQTALSERTARLYAEQVSAVGQPGSIDVRLEEWAQIDQEWSPAIAEQFAELRSAYR